MTVGRSKVENTHDREVHDSSILWHFLEGFFGLVIQMHGNLEPCFALVETVEATRILLLIVGDRELSREVLLPSL